MKVTDELLAEFYGSLAGILVVGIPILNGYGLIEATPVLAFIWVSSIFVMTGSTLCLLYPRIVKIVRRFKKK